jgi:hypothetical protein
MHEVTGMHYFVKALQEHPDLAGALTEHVEAYAR